MDRSTFIKLFNSIIKHRHTYGVFRDFVTLSAISLHNAVKKDESLEQEYLAIVSQYDKEELSVMCELLSILVELLEPEPRDILGDLYMDLGLANEKNGQFFTPAEISLMMAKMLYGDQLKEINKPFITLSEPACGAGGMVLAFAKVMIDSGQNPAEKLWVQCIDIDRMVALMCYVQLSLWNIPAHVIVGDALGKDFNEGFYTPAYYLFGWSNRLAVQEALNLMVQKPKLDHLDNAAYTEPLSSPKNSSGQQFDFNF